MNGHAYLRKLGGFGTGSCCPIDCRRVFGGTRGRLFAMVYQSSEPFTKVIHILGAPRSLLTCTARAFCWRERWKQLICGYKVSRGMKQDGFRKRTKLYLVKWANYSEQTWERSSNIEPGLMVAYHREHPAADASSNEDWCHMCQMCIPTA